MKQSSKSLLIAVAVVLAVAQIGALFLLQAWLYAVIQLRVARAKGVFATPEEGMRALCVENRYAAVTEIEIDHAGVDRHDGTHPHVWHVIAKVWADKRPDGKPTHPRWYYVPGSPFVRTGEGWVHVPEGRFPHQLGAYMQLFGLVRGNGVEGDQR